MNKFKVGDIVTGTLQNGYGYTNANSVMVVTGCYKETISVRIIGGEYVKEVGDYIFSGLEVSDFIHYDTTPFEGNV